MMVQDRLNGIINGLKEGLPLLDPKIRIEAIARVRDIIDRELLNSEIPSSEISCPKCKSENLIRFGRTAAGTQRYRCTSCGRTTVPHDTGGILFYTKLPRETWMRYAECFVDGLSCDRVAERLGVCHKTAWFMRTRLCEAAFNEIPSFQIKGNTEMQIDEMYIAESFKGKAFKKLKWKPRKAKKRGSGHGPAGTSNNKICIVTGVNDTGDMFYDIPCRGRPGCDDLTRAMESKVSEGAIVNTDMLRGYGPVLSNLKASVHRMFEADTHEGLNRVNGLHSRIRGFLRRFNGVSTKWLHIYLCWFKWLDSFAGSSNGVESAIRHIVKGEYVHKWKDIAEMSQPFRDWRMCMVKS